MKLFGVFAKVDSILWMNALIYIGVPFLFVFKLLDYPQMGIDDAVIFFTYAKNFAAGHGIVYNIGGEHVEGFTSLLYFLICSFCYRFSSVPEHWLFFYNIGACIASTFFILKALKTITQAQKLSFAYELVVSWIFLVWLLMSPFYFSWVIVSLMDVGTYGLLMALAYGFFIRLIFSTTPTKSHAEIMILVSLMLICRPEGMAWNCLFIVCYGFIVAWKKSIVEGVKASLWPLGSLVMGFILITVFRLHYFGYPLPNTYYAKVSSSLYDNLSDGWFYLVNFVDMQGYSVFISFVLLTIWVINEMFRKKMTHLVVTSILSLAFVYAGLLIPVLEGGDHFNGFRLFQNIYPLLIVPSILLLLIFKRSFAFTYVVSILYVVLLVYFNQNNWFDFRYSNLLGVEPVDSRMRSRIEYQVAQEGIQIGKHLNAIFQGEQSLPTIGFEAAGGIAFAYDGFVYDLMGLNDTKMGHAEGNKHGGYKGHRSFNAQVFFEEAPDIFKPSTVSSIIQVNFREQKNYYESVGAWDNLLFKNIFNNPKFKSRYTFAIIKNQLHPKYQCYGYFNNNYLTQLTDKGYFNIQRFG